MAKQRKAWMPGPATRPKPSLPGTVKDEVDTKAKELIEKVLKSQHVKVPAQDKRFNYITDITIKWLGSKCFFVSIYACPGPNALSPFFESKFVRMDYAGNGKFNLAFMRHTGQWVQLFEDQTVDECMTAIKEDPWFVP